MSLQVLSSLRGGARRLRRLRVPGPPGHGGSEGRDPWSRRLPALLGLAFLLRLLVAVPGMGDPESAFLRNDSASYMNPARALLETGEYRRSPESPEPATRRVPGFPLFLAALFALPGDDLRLPVVVFCMVSALGCLPIFRAGRLLGGSAVGFLAAAFYALNLTSIAQAPFYLSDGLFGLLVAFAFHRFVLFSLEGRLRDLFGAALLVAVATLVRPITLPWILPCVVLVLLYRRMPLRRRSLGALGCVLIFALVLTPWMARNRSVGAGFLLGTNVGDQMYYFNAPALVSVVTGESAEELRGRWMAEAEREFREHPELFPNEGARTRYKMEKAKEIIREHPFAYLRLYVQPAILLPDAPAFLELLGLTTTRRGTLDVLTRRGLIAAIENYFGDRLWLLLPLLPLLAVAGLLYLGFGVQLVRWIVNGRGFLVLTSLAFVFYFLVLPGPMVMPRYQIPALPMMCSMAALAGADAWNRRRARRVRGAGVA
jgi:hypothetical protein